MTKALYKTKLGRYYISQSEKLLLQKLNSLKGKVQLIFTSPPFPLNNKKKYGNFTGKQFKEWFTKLAPLFADLLAENGSIVIDLGNGWESRRPVPSLLHLESLLGFVKNPPAGLRLCQQFVCYNPARLPSPAQWVTVNRIRTIDSFTHVWWMSKTDFPKADNKKVLRPYSDSMKKLLKKKKFNEGKRPSEHEINKTAFLKNNNGSIMHNVIQLEHFDGEKNLRAPENVFNIANTNSSDFFMRTCKERGITPHPARMPLELAAFFIEFLTDQDDLVLDPFAGSNTTGFIAEVLGRRWLSIDYNKDYAEQSKIRFEDPLIKTTAEKKRRKVSS